MNATASSPLPTDPPRASAGERVWVALFWTLLVAGIVLHVPVPIGRAGDAINLSLYDAVLPALFVVAALRGEVARPSRGEVAVFVVLVALVLGHGAATLWLDADARLAPLARETAKTLAFLLDLGLLVLVFRASPAARPAPGLIAALLVATIAYAVTRRMAEISGQGTMYETLFLGTVFGLLVLFVARLDPIETLRRAGAVAALAALAAATAFILAGKAFFAVGLGIVAIAGATMLVRASGRRWIALALAAATLIALGAAASSGRIPQFGLGVADSISVSLGIRLTLWRLALDAIGESFPWGIGAGQFSPLTEEIPVLVAAGLRVVHDTPLALTAELGALGVLFAVLLAALILRVAWTWSWPVRLCFLLYISVPFLLNDMLGFRVIHLLLALGLARVASPDAGSSNTDSPGAELHRAG